jgi:DNA-binding MarR family transcriptional regulator
MESSFSKSFMYSVHQMYFLVQKHLEKKLQVLKTLSFSQFLIIVCFVDCKKKQESNQTDIAKYLNYTEATVSRHMEKLVKLKYIKKAKDENNKRKQVITMTELGISEFQKAKKIIEDELEKIFGVIDIKERKKIIDNFDKVLKKLITIN